MNVAVFPSQRELLKHDCFYKMLNETDELSPTARRRREFTETPNKYSFLCPSRAGIEILIIYQIESNRDEKKNRDGKFTLFEEIRLRRGISDVAISSQVDAGDCTSPVEVLRHLYRPFGRPLWQLASVRENHRLPSELLFPVKRDEYVVLSSQGSTAELSGSRAALDE